MNKTVLYSIISVICSAIVVIFAVQNLETITVTFLFWKVPEVPVFSVIIVSAAFGALAMLFLGTIWRYRRRANNRPK